MRLVRFVHRRDQGSVMIAVLMLILVVAAIGVGATQVAQHSNDATSVDRERLQTIGAAEAGVTDAIRRLEAGTACNGALTPTRTDLKDGDKLVGQFQTKVSPDTSVPPDPSKCVIDSWGYAPTGSTAAGPGTRALRHLEVTVKLVPQSGFPYTLFAEGLTGTIYVKNSGTITGDAYAETLDQSKNNISAENIHSLGSIITKNNAVYSGTLWSGGNVNLGSNSTIGGSVIASGTASGTQGTIALQDNSVVAKDAIARSTVTLGSGAHVNGAISQNNPNVPPPPTIQRPTYAYNAANYSLAPTTGTAAQITTAINNVRNNLQGTFRSTDASGTVVFPDNVTITGPLSVASAGKVELGRNISVSGGPYRVVIIAESTAADAINVTKSFTASAGVSLLLYSNGGVDQKNAVSFTGAIYADWIDVKNTITVLKDPSLATNAPPGFTFYPSSTSKYIAVPTLWREIVPGTPPS